MPQVSHRNWVSPVLARGPVYVDSSVVVAHLIKADKFNTQAVRFIGDHHVGQVPLLTSLLTIDETGWHLLKRMTAKAWNLTPSQLQLHVRVKAGPHVLAPFLPRLSQLISNFTALVPLAEANCTAADLWASWFARLSDVGGFQDAYHLALTEKLTARSFVTADSDFRKVRTLPFALDIYYL